MSNDLIKVSTTSRRSSVASAIAGAMRDSDGGNSREIIDNSITPVAVLASEIGKTLVQQKLEEMGVNPLDQKNIELATKMVVDALRESAERVSDGLDNTSRLGVETTSRPAVFPKRV